MTKKRSMKEWLVRVIVDVTFTVAGVLSGGIFGIGTLVCAFVVGTAAGILMPYSHRIVEAVLSHFA